MNYAHDTSTVTLVFNLFLIPKGTVSGKVGNRKALTTGEESFFILCRLQNQNHQLY
jgi:hypothetical protein